MTDAETIRSYFEPFLDLDPTRYDGLLKDLANAHEALRHEDMGKISDVKDDVSDWQGAAADSFNENVLAPFPGTVDLEVQLVDELILATAASREVALRAQRDIITIVIGAEAGLEALDGNCGCSKDMLTKLLGIFTAIAGALAGIGAILGAVGAAATAAGVTSSAAAAAAPQVGVAASGFGLLSAMGSAANNFNGEAEEIALKGETVEEILESARDAISKLNKGIDDQEKKIRTALEDDTRKLDGLRMVVSDIDLPMTHFRPTI